jgi:hypothetical protein
MHLLFGDGVVVLHELLEEHIHALMREPLDEQVTTPLVLTDAHLHFVHLGGVCLHGAAALDVLDYVL